VPSFADSLEEEGGVMSNNNDPEIAENFYNYPDTDHSHSDAPYPGQSAEHVAQSRIPDGPLHLDSPHTDRPHTDNPHTDRPHTDRPHSDDPHLDESAHHAANSSISEGGLILDRFERFIEQLEENFTIREHQVIRTVEERLMQVTLEVTRLLSESQTHISSLEQRLAKVEQSLK
jgi:hypothetical protein